MNRFVLILILALSLGLSASLKGQGQCAGPLSIPLTGSSTGSSLAAAITTQPTNRDVCTGATTTFSVAATGSDLTYQWRKNGSNLSDGTGVSGVTTHELTLTNVDNDDAADYSVVVTGSCGSPVTSNVVALTIKTLPSVTITPTPGLALSCITASTSLDAGTHSGYSWSTTATSQSISVSQAGTYTVTVTGSNGCTNTASVTVTGSGTPIGLTTSNNTASDRRCDENGRTYYGNGTNAFFSIAWGNAAGNQNAKENAVVTITLMSSPAARGTAPNRLSGMRRYWNVSAPTFAEPVNVRFYYDANEKSEVEFGGGTFRWYKTNNGVTFDPAIHLTNTGISGIQEITDYVLGTENGIPYVELRNLTSFSGGTGIGFEPSTPLPVELLSFDAKADQAINRIAWATALEQDVAHFKIERSRNGQTGWATIAQVKAKGSNSTYSSQDDTPFPTSYYRLRSVDIDGKEQLSKVVSVLRTSGKSGIKAVYPMPVTDEMYVDFESVNSTTVDITVTDITGRVILMKKEAVTEGGNNIRLDFSPFASGSYNLSIKDTLNTYNKRVIKQ